MDEVTFNKQEDNMQKLIQNILDTWTEIRAVFRVLSRQDKYQF